jgi:8-oxo-dGTP diphosphatase
VQLATSYIPLAVAGSQDIALPDTEPTVLYHRLGLRGYHVTRFAKRSRRARRVQPRRRSSDSLTRSTFWKSPASPTPMTAGQLRLSSMFPEPAVATVLRVGSRTGTQPMTDLPRHPVSVTGIVFRDDRRVLAIQRCDGRPLGATRRRSGTIGDTTRGSYPRSPEETGIRVQPERLTGVYKNMKRGVVTLAFRCSVISGHTHPTDESRQVAWLTVDEAKREMVEARAIRITDALSEDGLFVRTHDGTNLL